MFRPYIGIAGFTQHAQVRTVLDALAPACPRPLMVGVQVSMDTLRGTAQTEFARRRPPSTQLADILTNDSRALNYVHYNTTAHATLSEQLSEAVDLCGPLLHGFQLNLTWPAPHSLATFRTRHPSLGMVLQMGTAALSQVDNSPGAFCDRLKTDYEGLVDCILLDSGQGYGHPFAPEYFRTFLAEMASRELNMAPGVAGGICATTMHLVEPLIPEFPDLSFDSEAAFFDRDDQMNLDAASAYLLRGLELV
jgi:hypothetical protein